MTCSATSYISHSGHASRLVFDDCIEHFVNSLSVLHDTLAKSTFKLKSTFLQDAHGGRIPFLNECIKSHEIEIHKGILYKRPYDLSCYPLAPKRLSEPVSNLSGTPVIRVAQSESDTADCLVFVGDCEV